MQNQLPRGALKKCVFKILKIHRKNVTLESIFNKNADIHDFYELNKT